MTREELLKSDEYIAGYLECIIVSGKGIKQTRKEVAERWLAYRNELLSFANPPTEELSREGEKNILIEFLNEFKLATDGGNWCDKAFKFINKKRNELLNK